MSTKQNQEMEKNKQPIRHIYHNYPPPYSRADYGFAVQRQPNAVHPMSTIVHPTIDDGWMPMPLAMIQNCPVGLHYLSTIDQLFIQQSVDIVEAIIGFESNNKYAILNNSGEKMYYAVEENDCLTRNICGPLRKFEMKIFDNYGTEVIHLSRPFGCQECCFPCFLQKIEVYSPPGCLVGTVEQDWSLIKPIFTIRNALNEKVLAIKGPVCQFSMCGKDIKFKVMSKDKTTEVGRISKKWSGLVKEMFTDTENFGITFPMDLDVHMKAVMLGACFLIDFMFFESNGC